MYGLALNLHVGISLSGLGLRDIFSMNLHDIAVSILYDALLWVLRALYDIRILESYLLARTESEELLRSILHEVIALNPEFA